MKTALLAALAVLALVPASASAASTITVNDTVDAPLESGATECKSTDAEEGCTLRAAVELAVSRFDEELIVVPEGTFKLPEGPLGIESDDFITIAGAGQGRTIIDGEDEQRVFEIEEDSLLDLQGVTVRRGDGAYGGAILVESRGELVVEHSTITESQAGEGGGIYGEQESSVQLNEATVDDNRAVWGGGVAMETESRCDFATLNSKRAARHHTSARPGFIGFGEGGLVVSRSTIEDNTAAEGDGGGIFVGPVECAAPVAQPKAVSPHSLAEQESVLRVVQSTIAGNHADGYDINGDTFNGKGGGVYLEGVLVEDPIIDSTITANSAGYTGGGVYVREGFEALVSDTVADNVITPPEEEEIGARPAPRGAVKPATDQLGEGTAANLATETDSIAKILLRNTIVSETETGDANCEGQVESLTPGSGHNLDDPSTGEGATDACGMSAEDQDLLGRNPQLDGEGLKANGGPTRTIAIPAGSPAIGQVPISGDCELEETGPALPAAGGATAAVDQRGLPRPGIPGSGCDIGAYEYQQPAVTPETKTPPAPAGSVLSLKITSPPVCASKRDITIHIQNVKQFGVVSAVVSVDGKARRTLKGKRLRTAINLRGLPKGTFTVSIVAHTRNGKTLHGQRVYHTCHTKLPGHLRLRL